MSRRGFLVLGWFCAATASGCSCFVPVREGVVDGGGATPSYVLTASDWVMIDEEFPTWARTERLHIRDDAKQCAGRGAVRTLVRWDLSALGSRQVSGDATARFTYSYGWDGYAAPARPVALHRVTQTWTDTTDWATAPSVDPAVLGTVTLAPTAGTTIEFRVPAAVVQAWQADPAQNHGVEIKFASEDCPMPRWPADFDPPELDVPVGPP